MPEPSRQPPARAIVDAAVEVSARGVRLVGVAAGAVGFAARPALRFAWRPPVLPERMWPQTHVERLAAAGRARREQADGQMAQVLDGAVPAIADAIIARLDMDAIVNRLDLVTIVNKLIEEIDLPSIIRESSSGMASDAMLDVRMRSIEADEIVNRVVDKILRRRKVTRAASTRAPMPPASENGRKS